jgi:hypothetical protein
MFYIGGGTASRPIIEAAALQVQLITRIWQSFQHNKARHTNARSRSNDVPNI